MGKMVGFMRLSQVLGPTHYCECKDRERNVIGRLNVKAISSLRNMLSCNLS